MRKVSLKEINIVKNHTFYLLNKDGLEFLNKRLYFGIAGSEKTLLPRMKVRSNIYPLP